MTSRLLLSSLAATALLASPVLAATPAATPATPPAATSSQTAHTMQAPSSAHKADNTALYRSAQQKLHDLNLYTGEINGQRSSAYVSALRRFQREHHLTVNGRLDAHTRQALGIT